MDNSERSERLLALILLNQMKDAPQRGKILQLNLAGFTNVEIANILQTTAPVVAQVLYETKKGKRQSTVGKNRKTQK